jgi:hypothetical protein
MDEERPCTEEEVKEIQQRLQGGYLQHGNGAPDEARSFDCKKCGAHYVPLTTQWIFYRLCDECFVEYDKEKMAWRLENSGLGFLREE